MPIPLKKKELVLANHEGPPVILTQPDEPHKAGCQGLHFAKVVLQIPSYIKGHLVGAGLVHQGNDPCGNIFLLAAGEGANIAQNYPG